MHTLTIVPPASIKSFERQLLSTTALTPTHHKGGIGKILGFAAAIAVPFAAPAIASAIGVSSVLGQAMVGAGLGAVTSLATGGDPLRGALMGGITAGIGGAMRAPQFSGGAADIASGFAGAPGVGPPEAAFGAMGNTAGVVSAPPTGAMSLPAGSVPGWESGVFTGDPGMSLQSPLQSSPTTLGTQLSGMSEAAPRVGTLPSISNNQLYDAYNAAQNPITPSDRITYLNRYQQQLGAPANYQAGTGKLLPQPGTPGYNPGADSAYLQPRLDPGGTLPIQPVTRGTDPLFRSAFLEDPEYLISGNYGGGVRPAGLDASLVNTPFDPNFVPESAYGAGSYSPASAPAAGLATSMQQAGSTLSNLGSRGLEAFKGLSDPVKTALIQAGTSQIGSLLAGDEPEMTAAEKEALEYRKRMLAQQEAMLKKQEDVGMSLMNQANRIDPVFRGRQALVEEQNRLARAQARGLRGTNNREATLRRNALDMARTGAFSRGFQEAEARKQDATQRAAGALPNYAGLATAGANDARSSAEYFDRLKDERKNAGDMIQPILQQVAFGKSKEELDRDRQRYLGS